MPAYIDQPYEEIRQQISVGNLPFETSSKQIRLLFERFGVIVQLYFKRRVSKESSAYLPNPSVLLTFQRQESVDQILAARPHSINGCLLFVHRCLPVTRRYPYETYFTVNQILVRTSTEHHQAILPADPLIETYLKSAGGQIMRLERWDERTVFVEFDDYDPVDVCCLSRPHWIADQLVEIEKCYDEHRSRRQAQFRQKSRSVALKLSPNHSTSDADRQSNNTLSPTLNYPLNEHTAQLRLTYSKLTDRLEEEHEQHLATLTAHWRNVAKERLRFQRLTLDCQQESQRLTEQIQRCTKLEKENLQEQARLRATVASQKKM